MKIKQNLFNLACQTGSVLAGTLTAFMVARNIGADAFGLYVILLTLAGVVPILTRTSLTSTLNAYISEHYRDDANGKFAVYKAYEKIRTKFSLYVSLMASLICLVVFYRFDQTAWSAWLGAVLVFIQSCIITKISIKEHACILYDITRNVYLSELSSALLNFIFIFGMLSVSDHPCHLFIAFSLAQLFRLLYLQVKLRRFISAQALNAFPVGEFECKMITNYKSYFPVTCLEVLKQEMVGIVLIVVGNQQVLGQYSLLVRFWRIFQPLPRFYQLTVLQKYIAAANKEDFLGYLFRYGGLLLLPCLFFIGVTFFFSDFILSLFG
ncbi:MAG: hypothetical protein AAF571_12505, partial [Verrucomicrobiota bacterium]